MMMKPKSKTLTLMLTFSLILFVLIGDDMQFSFSTENRGGKLDIFTQKEPFSGRGLNLSSDAFSPEENVVIYASVVYNDYPVAMAHVAFEIHGPENPVYNITFFDSAQTDSSGIANISFRIGLESDVNFGKWRIVGSVSLADEVLRDFLSFKVGWIVKIVSVKTMDENNVERTKFTKGSRVGVELSVQNIAMIEKKATITIAIYDFLSVLVNSTQIDDYELPANGTILYIHCFLTIPEWASTGDAVVSACAYTAPISIGGVPYCPKVSGHFLIIHHDVAILRVETSHTVVYKGETVNIDVTVKNLGYEIESFNLSSYYNKTNLVGARYVSNLQIDANLTVRFIWNTSSVIEGFYQISAHAEPVPDEIDISDNTYIDGVVEVKAKPLLLIVHDVAVSTVCPYSNFTYVGEVLEIFVIVKNKGNSTESFNVTAFYDSHIVETLPVENLEPNDKKTLVFHWNTQDVAEGNYTVSAQASQVPGEENLKNNSYEDGTVTVAKAPKGRYIPNWSYWLFPLLLVIPAILLIAWYYSRKRRRDLKRLSIQVWTA